MGTNNLGRDKLDWTQDMWNVIDQAVHDEAKRTKIAAQFLPLYPTDVDMMTVQSDAVNSQTVPLLTVNEEAVTPLIEIWTEFALTKQQYENEAGLKTAVTLAINAVNKLSRAEDLLIFQGDAGVQDDLFQSQTVNLRGAQRNQNKIESRFPIVGLLPSAPKDQIIPVEPTEPNANDPTQNRYGENTFGAVAKGYSVLQRTHYGRDALVLPTNPFADTWAPLRTTLIMPADRIKGLVSDRFYGTSTLPNSFDQSNPDKPIVPQGLLVALDGNTMDLVMGMDATTAFMQTDGEGLYRFRVFERFTLRLKDSKAVVRLEFQKGNSGAIG
ncbi:MAG: encapsulin [Chroococcidiopsidaceae cyanobacterium CP_BM_RX_35]|nr:encapsulin [Chroococcidiopsidaceae cyanobacterium CP_BM_RX_35]